MYTVLSRLFPAYPLTSAPERIVFIQPCCIGDVVMATAALKALRQAYPQAHITWAVGGWSRRVIENHLDIDTILDTGETANPAAGLQGLWRFVRLLRAGKYDLAISLVRSPWMSMAVFLSGIENRVGLDSAGRGFGYSVRSPVDPARARHEAEIYLDVMRMLGFDPVDCYANLPVLEEDRERVQTALQIRGIEARYIVINPAGGRNPGMVMDSKRWPPQNFAKLAEALYSQYKAHIVFIGGPDDVDIVQAVTQHLKIPNMVLAGVFSFGEIAALAQRALCYIGNDTGLTHVAAATGVKTVMIMGPSDPQRYAPFVTDALTLWKPVQLRQGGVAAAGELGWDWGKDGIGVDAAIQCVMSYIDGNYEPSSAVGVSTCGGGDETVT